MRGSRLVLLHVADGWAARTYGPDAVSPEITEDKAYLEKVRAEFQATGIPRRSGTGLRRSRERNHQLGGTERLRPGRHEHSRAPLSGRSLPGHDGIARAAQCQRAGAVAEGQVNAEEPRVLADTGALGAVLSRLRSKPRRKRRMTPSPDAPVANPARPTVSTPATLTPVGYLQFETGILACTGSRRMWFPRPASMK